MKLTIDIPDDLLYRLRYGQDLDLTPMDYVNDNNKLINIILEAEEENKE